MWRLLKLSVNKVKLNNQSIRADSISLKMRYSDTKWTMFIYFFNWIYNILILHYDLPVIIDVYFSLKYT